MNITMRDLMGDVSGFAQIKFSTFEKPDVETDFLSIEKADELFDALENSERCYEAEMKSWKLDEDTGKYVETCWRKRFDYQVLEMWGRLVKVVVDYGGQ